MDNHNEYGPKAVLKPDDAKPERVTSCTCTRAVSYDLLLDIELED